MKSIYQQVVDALEKGFEPKVIAASLGISEQKVWAILDLITTPEKKRD